MRTYNMRTTPASLDHCCNRDPKAESLELVVWDWDGKPGKADDLLGTATIPVADVLGCTDEAGVEKVVPLTGGLVKEDKKGKEAPTITLKLRWIANTGALLPLVCMGQSLVVY